MVFWFGSWLELQSSQKVQFPNYWMYLHAGISLTLSAGVALFLKEGLQTIIAILKMSPKVKNTHIENDVDKLNLS